MRGARERRSGSGRRHWKTLHKGWLGSVVVGRGLGSQDVGFDVPGLSSSARAEQWDAGSVLDAGLEVTRLSSETWA